MCPILLDFEFWGERLRLHAYATGMTLSVLIVALLGWRIAVRRGLPKWPSFAYCVSIAVAMPVGSRVLYWAMRPEQRAADPELLTSLQFHGFYMSGGFLLAVVTAAAGCWLLRLDGWRMVDAIAPALGLAGVAQRVGCFLNGCCFGHPTSLPWSVTFPFGSPAHRCQLADRFDLLFTGPLPVHPTQLYEMVATLVAAGLAWQLHRPNIPNGVPALVATAWFLGFRWLERFFRADGMAGASPQWLVSCIYAAVILLCFAAIHKRYTKETRCATSAPA